MCKESKKMCKESKKCVKKAKKCEEQMMRNVASGQKKRDPQSRIKNKACSVSECLILMFTMFSIFLTSLLSTVVNINLFRCKL